MAIHGTTRQTGMALWATHAWVRRQMSDSPDYHAARAVRIYRRYEAQINGVIADLNCVPRNYRGTQA